MIAPRHLARAPIKEGLIDLRVVLAEQTAVEQLDSLYPSISEDYPKKELLLTGGIEIRIDATEARTGPVNRRQTGYRYTSRDGKHVAQFRVDGFTFSRLEPYETWEAMRAEAVRLWNLYSQAAKPIEITRVATRYINVLRIPLPITDFGKFMTAPPHVPDSLPQGVSSFLTRLVIHEPSLRADCIITQALEGTAEEVADIVLDIDVIVKRAFDISRNEYWDVLEQLRHFKNKVFFASITERTAELFQ
jgi:uncharacterized protein (TIGR04255 family)